MELGYGAHLIPGVARARCGRVASASASVWDKALAPEPGGPAPLRASVAPSSLHPSAAARGRRGRHGVSLRVALQGHVRRSRRPSPGRRPRRFPQPEVVGTSLAVLFLFYFHNSHLNRMTWHFVVILVCIALMSSGPERFFMCLLATCVSSTEKCLFGSLAH